MTGRMWRCDRQHPTKRQKVVVFRNNKKMYDGSSTVGLTESAGRCPVASGGKRDVPPQDVHGSRRKGVYRKMHNPTLIEKGW